MVSNEAYHLFFIIFNHYFLLLLATDLIKKLLEKNISKRFTAQQVLEHPWLKDKVNINLFTF